MRLRRLTAPLLLITLLLSAAGAAATDIAAAAIAYAKKNHRLASEAVTSARAQIQSTESDLRVARSIEKDALQQRDQEALTVAQAAITESKQGLQEARQLLAHAQQLLAQRERAINDLRASLSANNHPQHGVIVADSGDVRRYNPDGSLASSTTGTVHTGERLQTGPTGRVRLFIANGQGEVVLAPNSELTITADGRLDDFLVELKRGALRLLAHSRELKRKFEVRTPSAVTSVRGTDFSVENVGAETQIRVFTGVVGVTLLSSGQLVDVPAGYLLQTGTLTPRPFDVSSSPSPWENSHAER
jgi:ferric-dicitrate binding protein FerR (iron transport regulator)